MFVHVLRNVGIVIADHAESGKFKYCTSAHAPWTQVSEWTLTWLNCSSIRLRRLDMAFVNPIRNYSEKKLIGYTREQLFEVVAAVENYHLFVPACRKSEVVQRSRDRIKAKLEIGLPPLLEAYTSNVKLEKPKLILATCTEGVLFKHLETRWKFNLPPRPCSPDEFCLLDFYVTFEFKSLLYARLASPVFDEMVRLNVSAFLKRAEKLYGPPHKINGFITEQHH